MSEAIHQAEELRGRAIALLLAERQAIDDQLAMFGVNGIMPSTTPTKQRTCGKCGSSGHNATTCKKAADESAAGATP